MPATVPASCVVFLFLLATALPAQLPGPGLSWSGTTGSVTSFLPTCQALPVAALRGESVTLRVHGDVGSLFVLGASVSASQCLPVPGLGNGLVLDLPVVTVAVGTLTQLTPCLACPPGFEPLPLTVPNFLPPGITVAFQAVGFGNGAPAFTTAIAVAVR